MDSIDLSAGLKNPASGIDLSGGLSSAPPAQPPAAPANAPGFGDFAEQATQVAPPLGSPAIGSMTAGAAKSGAGLVGNVLDLVSRPKAPVGFTETYRAQNPKATPEEAEQAYREQYAQTPGGKISQHLQDAANWLRQGSQPEGFWEHVGAVGEQVLEYLGTDGLLKLAGGGALAANAAGAAGKAGKATEALDNAKQLAQTIAKNPKLAGLLAVGLKASKDAALMGGQTYLHTEDPAQAATAAGLGAAARVGGEAVGQLGKWVQKVRPTTIDIAGVKIPVLSTQLNQAAQPVETGAAAAPAIAAEQQTGAQSVIRNTAQDATSNALAKINQTRPAAQAITDQSRLLPAGEGAQPFTFTLGPGAEPVEGVTGDLLQPAGKVPQPAAFPPKYTTDTGSMPIEGSEGTTGADVSTATPQDARADRVSGATGGPLQTTNPQTAESWLRRLEEIEQGSGFKNLTSAQQQGITAQREQLGEQLGLYHASPYAQRFDPIDIGSAVDHVRTFGDAADQVRAASKPVYAKLDQVSGGEFDKYNKAAKQALRIMRSATSTDAYESAAAKYQDANSAINNLLDRHAGDVSRSDYTAAKLAWRDSSRLDELHSVFERMMNGITAEESDQGLSRVMTGRTKALQNYLDKADNAAQIKDLIGDEGVLNLKRLTTLMAKPNTARSSIDLMKNVARQLGKHTLHSGGAAMAGGWLGHVLGVPYWQGAMTGAVSSELIQGVMRTAMTNPRVGALVDYAVQNGVSPAVYAPLIARSIAEPFEQPNEKADNEQGEK